MRSTLGGVSQPLAGMLASMCSTVHHDGVSRTPGNATPAPKSLKRIEG
jgi:hypothetical protein